MNHSTDDSEATLELHLPDANRTLEVARALARTLQPGLHIYLSGDLGAGKTTFVRGVLLALGYGGPVRSPTYTLVESYVISRLNLYHFDFYRFQSPSEWWDSGFDELFGSNAVCLVEWPERAHEVLPQPDLQFKLVPAGLARNLLIRANTQAGARCVSELKSLPGSS